jgi:hypothetical protein
MDEDVLIVFAFELLCCILPNGAQIVAADPER